ncbi:MAG TPA: putative metal-dependent hydrolase [Candidatus Limnocylindrales bacterium]|nr:putative metal-dependent hydrolase [Candidatus Limnocylindrales bacterium]
MLDWQRMSRRTNFELEATVEEDLRYPVGKWEKKGPFTPTERKQMIDSVEATPNRFRSAVAGLNDKQLDTPYRHGGWTVRQTVHHVADSHMNAYIRFRLGVTEAEPTVKPYDEKQWADLLDARTAPVDISLEIIDGIHRRWAILLHSVREIDFNRAVRHPENGVMSLDDVLALYEWHGRHHAAHITALRTRNGW